ncbi:AMP-binding protein [Brevibacterium atlanticum]|uniref:AMP-binding protein n=1 Tax=Brevibacterium atlanticum TaxID=2697563 RepID=UPI00141FEC55|nr:AMP-binding protein [Brevibacterium atlanticum]
MNTTPDTLYGHLKSWVAADPQRTALVDPEPDRSATTPIDGGHRRVTVTDLLARADEFARLLSNHQVGPGDCIGVWIPSWSDAYAWQFAASACGAHVIGVNTRYNVAEVSHVLAKARPRVLVMAHGFGRVKFLDTAVAAVAEARRSVQEDGTETFTPPVSFVWAVPGAQTDPTPADYDLGSGSMVVPRAPRLATAASTGDLQTAAGSDDRLAVAFTTSGSTGMPKLAAHRESAVISHAVNAASAVGLSPGDLMVEPLPYSGVFGYCGGMAALFAGAAVLLHPVFDETELLRAWEHFGGTHFVGADDMLSRVRRACGESGIRLDSWKWAGVADFQGMSAEIAQWASAEFGTRTVGVYGSSEVFALATLWPTDTSDDLRYSGGGQLVDPSYEYRIADPATDEPMSDGDDGEIQLSGTNVVNSYLGDSGEGAKNFTADGWFRTGDLGRAKGPHSFEYICRMGDVIRLRGFLVDPAEIETHIITHEDVELVKVVGRTNDLGEPEVVAFVQGVHDRVPDEEQIIAHCCERLARYKVPAEVRVIDAMPVTAGTNGSKIKAAVLRDWAAQPRVQSALG